MIDYCEHVKDSDIKKCYCLWNKVKKYERALNQIADETPNTIWPKSETLRHIAKQALEPEK